MLSGSDQYIAHSHYRQRFFKNNTCKDKSLPKECQLEDNLARIRLQPKEIWMIKLADRITNLVPQLAFWDQGKRKHYLQDEIIIHEALKDVSATLSAGSPSKPCKTTLPSATPASQSPGSTRSATHRIDGSQITGRIRFAIIPQTQNFSSWQTQWHMSL